MPKTPQYWINFLIESNLQDQSFEIPAQNDLSQLGAMFKLLDEKEIECEMDDYHPGIIVKDDGFIPVASCLKGSGDPYFINVNDGPGGALYRIYHDVVHNHTYDQEEAVDVVITSYSQLKSFLE